MENKYFMTSTLLDNWIGIHNNSHDITVRLLLCNIFIWTIFFGIWCTILELLHLIAFQSYAQSKIEKQSYLFYLRTIFYDYVSLSQ